MKNRNSSERIGAERHAVWTKITSPTPATEIHRDAWRVNPMQMSIIQVEKKRPQVLKDGCTVPIKHAISPYVFLLYF